MAQAVEPPDGDANPEQSNNNVTTEFDDTELANAVLIADDIWSNSKMKREKTINLLMKIISNIRDHPTEMKYRQINMAKISSKPSILPQFRQMLSCAGWSPNKNGVHFNLAEDKQSLCVSVGEMIADRVKAEDEELEKERERIKEETKRKQKEYTEKAMSKRNSLKKIIEGDMRSKKASGADKVYSSSKSNNLQFGRTDVAIKFKSGG